MPSPPLTTMPRLFKNGRIFTSVEGDSTLHDSLVTDGDKVVYVGTSAEAEAKAVSWALDHLHHDHADMMTQGASATVTDLGGAVVLPGLIDGHIHTVQFGSALSKVECLGLSADEIAAAIKKAYEANPGAKMIHGKSFLYDALGQPPHRKFLDAVVPDVPVFIASMDLHASLLNTAAINALGVTRDTPNPKGGEFVRDADGELTGHFLETANFEFVWPWIAKNTSLEDRVVALEDAFENMLASGLTGGIEMALTPEDLEAIEEYIKRNGKLPVRISAHWFMRPEGTDESRADQVSGLTGRAPALQRAN